MDRIYRINRKTMKGLFFILLILKNPVNPVY